MNVKWRPEGALASDTIPFFWKGKYHVFFLLASRSSDPALRFRTDWGHLVSSDLVYWEELPVALKPGPKGTPDASGVWTGSVIEREGTFHVFYTGFNAEDPRYSQTICHATSKDLEIWEKDRSNPVLKSDAERYETQDWRDPYVFWNEEANSYWMILVARTKSGPVLRRGCVVLATSDDLRQWKIDSDFWCPNLCYYVECPEIFRWDDRWYLVWSKFSKMGSYYQISEEIRGPWRAPLKNQLDGKYFYAARTAGDGSRRFAFGWIPIRQGEWDTGYIEWGGDLAIPHELIKQHDGTLASRCPPEIVRIYKKSLGIALDTQLGKWDKKDKSIEGERLDGLGYTFIPVDGDDFLFETSITLGQDTPTAGVLLRTDPDLSEGYRVRFDPVFRRVVIDQWTLRVNTPEEALNAKGLSTRTDPNPLVEQPLEISPFKAIDCKVFISGSTVQVFVEERVVLSYRIYKSTGFRLGLYVEAGRVQFDNVRLSSR